MNPTAKLLEPEFRELIEQGHYAQMREIMHELDHADTADILKELEPRQAAVAFRFMPRDDAAEVFSYFDAEEQEELIRELGDAAARVVEGMGGDDIARLLDELPGEISQRLVNSLSPETRRQAQVILGYPARSVGRLMTPDYIRVKPEWTMSQALEHVRQHGRDAETVNVLYVTDAGGRLIDDVRLRQVLLAPPTATIDSIMNDAFVALRATDPQEDAVRQMARYDRTALPVVDSRGVLLGIVTVDDIADVAEAEATEDIQKLGGVEALEDTYTNTGHLEMFRKRGVWLGILFVGQTITIVVLGGFQDQLEKAAILAIFLPLVISCGGNSGSQAATLVTRALALGEVGSKDWLTVVKREVVTALMLGSALAMMALITVEVFSRIGHPTTPYAHRLGIAVAATVLCVVLWGTIVGSLLPLFLKRMKLDPATASTPMVATMMDASGTLIYLGLAILILTGTIL